MNSQFEFNYDDRSPFDQMLSKLEVNTIRLDKECTKFKQETYMWLAGAAATFVLPFWLVSRYGFPAVGLPSTAIAAMSPVASLMARNSASHYKKRDRLLYHHERYLNRLKADRRENERNAHNETIKAMLDEMFSPPQEQQQQQVFVPSQPPINPEWVAEKRNIENIFKNAGKDITVYSKEVRGSEIHYVFGPTSGIKLDGLTELSGGMKASLLVHGGFPEGNGKPKIEAQVGKLVLVVNHPHLYGQRDAVPVVISERSKEPIAAAQPQEQQQQPPRFVEDGPSFTIVPPSPQQQQSPVYSPVQQQPQGDHLRVMLGYGRNDGIPRYWDLSQQANGFFLGLGASGSGKTETLKVLAIEVKHYGIPVLITDFHGDIEIGEFKTITLSHSPQLPYGVNPLELDSIDPRDGGVYAQIQIVLEMLKTCVSGMGHQQYRIIKQALEIVYAQRGIKDSDPKTFTLAAPTFGEVLDVLELMVSDEETTSQQRNTAASAIAVVSKVFEHPIFSKPKQLSPRELSQGWYRLNMKHLEEHIKYVVAETLLRKASRYLRSQGHIAVQPQSDRDRFRWFFMVDEAKVLSMGGANKDNANAPLNKAATEDRKFGLGMALFSQITDHFSKELLAQFAARLVMKPFDADEARANAATIGVKPEDLMQLEGKGDGYLKLGNGNPADRIGVLPTFKRPGYQPYIEQEEELAEEDPYEVFDEVFEDKHGFDPDEVLSPEPENTPDPWGEKPTANNPFDMVIDWIKSNHPDRITDRNFPSDEKLSEFLIQWFRQQGQEIPPPSKASLLDFRNVINAKRGV